MPSNFREEKTEHKLQLLRHKEEEENVERIAKQYKLPYADLSIFPIEVDAIKLVPEGSAKQAELAAFQVTGWNLKIALRNPENPLAKKILRDLGEQHYQCGLYLVSKRSLEHAWEFYKKIPLAEAAEAGAIQLHEERLTALSKELTDLAGIKSAMENASSGHTTEILEIILAGALATDSSDIHIEPQEKEVRLRFRLDGVLHEIARISEKLYHLLLSRIKLISELKLNVHDRAQDGRFTIHTQGIDIEVRSSILPGPDGENVVLRILNPKSLDLKFEDLGMQPWIRETMEKELKKPNGMIVTTGPTGSGKTTTLYTILKKIHSPEIKIITLEDPIEYHLPGVEQTQVDAAKGYDFPKGLRAIVRQDPDVILVGEIRDLETADTAINAALTGHLVFSTLHTNNAAGAVPRLVNLGVKPNSIAPAINVVMAQRLVRKLCPHCRLKQTLTDPQKQEIQKELDQFPKDIQTPKDNEWNIFSAKPDGCPSCNDMGYKGRISIFEIILMDDAMEELILKNPSEYEIKKEAARQGQITLPQDGLLKVLGGITDFAEVERATGTRVLS